MIVPEIDVIGCLAANMGQGNQFSQSGQFVAFGGNNTAGPLDVATALTVRRLTPRECERLQGFPDDYTAVSYRGKASADGLRYRALGNSMAVPCMRWLGERIEMVDKIKCQTTT